MFQFPYVRILFAVALKPGETNQFIYECMIICQTPSMEPGFHR